MRLGLVGTESDHAEDLLRLLNRDGRHPGWSIAAVWGERPGRTQALMSEFGVTRLVDEVEHMASEVDGALIVTRNGNHHWQEAEPFLERGLPVFVDKPFGCSVVQAETILARARGSALVLSASALRWQPDTEAMAGRIAELGGARSIVATGTCDRESEYGGVYFYGIHPAELALQLAGAKTGVTDISAERAGNGATIRCKANGIEVTVNLVPPDASGGIVFHAAAECRDGRVEARIGLGENYMAPVLDRFVAMVERNRPPLTDHGLVAPIRLLEAAEKVLTLGR